MNKTLIITISAVGAILIIAGILYVNHNVSCRNIETSYFNAKDQTSNSLIPTLPDIFASQCFGGGTLAPAPAPE